MARKVTINITLPGQAKEKIDEGMGLFPSLEWVQKNKHKTFFHSIVRNEWRAFIRDFTAALRDQYLKRANAQLSRSTNTDDSYSKRDTYLRAHKIPGSSQGTMEDVHYSSQRGYVSGLLYDTMEARLEFDGTDITILSPMNNENYKLIISSLVEQPGLKSYHLSKYLETQFGFISSGQNAWGFLTAGFKTGGTSYQLRMDAMNSALVAKERRGKRGKYKKRRR